MVARSGIERLAIVNGHGGNYVLSNIVQQANVAGPRMTLFPGRIEWEAARAAAGLQASTSEDMHAGELEVSLLLHTYPELVGDDFRQGDWEADPRPHLLVTGMRGYTESGVIGRPSLATAEKGRAILDSLARSFKDHLALLLRSPQRQGRPQGRQRHDGHRCTKPHPTAHQAGRQWLLETLASLRG